MFDPIVGPPDQHSGPAVGHTTEKGDTWHAAVGKINAGFEKLWHVVSGGAAVEVAAIDVDARNAFNALRTAHDKLVHDNAELVTKVDHYESVLSDLLFKVDALGEKVAAMTAPADANDKPKVEPEDDQSSLDAVELALRHG